MRRRGFDAEQFRVYTRETDADDWVWVGDVWPREDESPSMVAIAKYGGVVPVDGCLYVRFGSIGCGIPESSFSFLRRNSDGEFAKEQAPKRLRLVVVGNRELAFVGRVDFSGSKRRIFIEDARRVIKQGGTGDLAALVPGPTAETILGIKADVTVFRENVLVFYDLNEEGWRNG
jgi:hypothetical protein